MKVVDEAHMIYSWGLVESGKSKKLVAHGKNPDRGIFCPSYGQLGNRLMVADNVPILLMSATCRPVAVDAILASLKLTNSNITMLRGELTRPELRFIRVNLQRPLSSAEDLLRITPLASDVPDECIPQMLVYSGVQNDTLTALRVLNRGRGTPEDADNGKSRFAQCFHAATGQLDKKDRVAGYAAGDFKVMSCTMALGMGQNWDCCRYVVVLGDGDPSNTLQMLGRAGRDRRPGLGIIFVQKYRAGGKNNIEEYDGLANQTDDDRLDALRITPVCLRIAFTVDNTLVYVNRFLHEPFFWSLTISPSF